MIGTLRLKTAYPFRDGEERDQADAKGNQSEKNTIGNKASRVKRGGG